MLREFSTILAEKVRAIHECDFIKGLQNKILEVEKERDLLK